MCGIAGIFHTDATRPVDIGQVQRMCDVLIHRGPDDQGIYAHRNIAIGMRRLSIIGIHSGQQPISNEDKNVWVVLNGEIYNYLELRGLLIAKGHVFKTESDTECIVHLYEEFGDSCVHYLRGMYAFAILDERSSSLLLVRDRLGIKPLFYYLDNRKLVFASEMKAILQDRNIPAELDLQALDAYFTYNYIPSPLTIFKAIRKLEPGHLVKCSDREIRIDQYWDLHFRPNHQASEADLAEKFGFLFDKAVSSHLMSEVPLGTFLSGGVDSGMVLAFMARHMANPVQSFTMGFGGHTGGHLDERVYAKEVATRYSADYREFEVQPKIEDIIEPIVRSFDEPFADSSVIPTYYICKLAKQHITVALTGAGGDELFAGYERYLGLVLGENLEKLPVAMRAKMFPWLADRIPERWGPTRGVHYLKRFARGLDLDGASRYQTMCSALSDEMKTKLYTDDVQREINYAKTQELGKRYFNRPNAEDLLDKAMYQDLKMYLADDVLALSDRLSMLHSLELRVPFLDHKLVEFCATIPSSMKIKRFRKKYFLKKIARQFLPSDVISHKKQGFSAPMSSWLRGDLRAYTRGLLSERNVRKSGILNAQYVSRLVKDHQDGKESHDKLIFAMMIFQKWYELYS